MRTLLFAMIILLGACTSSKPSLPSLIDTPAVILEQNGVELFQYWELANEDFLWQEDLGEVKYLQLYKDSLAIVLGEAKLKAAIQFEAFQNRTIQQDSIETNGDKFNTNLVHTAKAGHIRPINFLEAQILNYQLKRYPLLGHPTEFHGFILKNEAANTIRVYFGASDQPWPPKPRIIVKAVKEDLTKGWKLIQHLHNHYESAATNYIGVMAPSLADAHYFKMLSEEYQVETALITNGFNTVELSKEEFHRFQSH